MPTEPLRLEIDPDLGRAQPLPAAVYHEPAWFERMRERVFARTWHLYPGDLGERSPGDLRPWNLLAGCLDEPLVITHDADDLHLLSNVCTHRGTILVERAGTAEALRCPHHGRCFSLGGRCTDKPRPAQAIEPRDHLTAVPHARWEHLIFGSLRPAEPFDALMEPLRARLSYLPWDRLTHWAAASRDYHLAAGWALVCEHLLDGSRGPVMPTEAEADAPAFTHETELLPQGVLQLYRGEGDHAPLDPPPEHPDHGRDVIGYRAWLFPGTVLDVYPWGMAVGVLLPLGPAHTRVLRLAYRWTAEPPPPELAARLDQREHEDGLRIESMARGLRARLHARGPYCADHERGVHHFHRLLARWLDDEG